MPSRAHKIRLDPTNKQATALARAAGCSRFAYNWALARWQEQYAAHVNDPSLPRPSRYSLRKQLNSIKRIEFPWMLESTKCAPQEAIIDPGLAFQRFFKGRNKYPSFKKRGVRDSFRLSSGQFSIVGKMLRVPDIGWIRMTEAVRFDGRCTTVTLSRVAGQWFASVLCEVAEPHPQAPSGETLGIDVGVGEYVVGDGARYPVPRAYRAAERRLRRAQQALSRKQKGSVNRAKARIKVARLHQRTADVRQDWLHKLTTELADRADTVVIEDLNVSGMLKNRYLSKSVSDAAFGEFRRQMEYKITDRGTELVVADRWYPSSKLCSICGTKAKSLPLEIRSWECGGCGAQHDRDLNAAINLAAYPANTAASSAVAACGAFSTAVQVEVVMLPSPVQVAAVKQEPDITCVSAYE